MYHPGKYKEHNESLKRFVKKFNVYSRSVGGRIVMCTRKNENFRDDGVIIDTKTNKEIIFDWEKRHSHYLNCGFPFKTFGQFERKIIKKEIRLSIQCSKNEDCFCIAWHEDFEKEPVENVPAITEDRRYEKTGKRYTTEFLELRYCDMDIFCKILEKAFDEDLYNSKSFK